MKWSRIGVEHRPLTLVQFSCSYDDVQRRTYGSVPATSPISCSTYTRSAAVCDEFIVSSRSRRCFGRVRPAIGYTRRIKTYRLFEIVRDRSCGDGLSMSYGRNGPTMKISVDDPSIHSAGRAGKHMFAPVSWSESRATRNAPARYQYGM